MVIYEVNLTIKNEIFNDYYNWLVEHIEIMLQFRGFRKAEIAKEIIPPNNINDTTKLTVHYSIENESDLDHYLNNYASSMRDDGIKKFGDKFSATRRIFRQTSVMESK